MKLVYKDMEQILRFDGGIVNELVIENSNLFFEMVNDAAMQVDGLHGGWVLSIKDTPVEFSRYADVTVQFAPFQVNRKSLLTKLYTELEQKSLTAENYERTGRLLCELEKHFLELADELPFEIRFQKLAIGPVIRAVSPEIDEEEKSTIERIFAYMELVRELDRDRLFIMVNMRSYFSDSDMENFTESICLHDFHVLLIENTVRTILKNTKRHIIDSDLCEI